jgi:hypothetical protein
MNYLFSFLLLWLPAIVMAQQSNTTTIIQGQILDSATNEPLRFVTVRVEDTPKGAMSSIGGKFLLKIPPTLQKDSFTLKFSMVGYRTERHVLKRTGDTLRINIALQPAISQMMEVVVSAEDPGVKLMRNVLKRKQLQRDSLRSYSYKLYTKFLASTDTITASRADSRADTTIVAIFESYSNGYFVQPDKYFNEITQRRQTANVPPEANFVAFGTNINVYDDYVGLLSEKIATPFHPDALDYYDFVLERQIEGDSLTISRVRVIPKTDRKLFAGTVDIDAQKFVPLSVDLTPNKAVQLPFDAHLTFDQKFEQVGRFVLPTGLHIFSTLEAAFLWILSPRLDITIETVAYDYEVNIPLDDNLFSKRRVELRPTAEIFDSTVWIDNPILPLRAQESTAYINIQRSRDNADSAIGSNLIDRTFGVFARIATRLGQRPFTGFEDIFRYNRVQGAYLGIGLRDDLSPLVQWTAKIGYSFADKRLSGELLLKKGIDEAQHLTLEASLYRRLTRRDNPYIVTSNGITPMALLFKNDYGDYFYSNGAEAAAEIGFGQLKFIRRDIFARPRVFRVFVRSEYQQSAPTQTNFAVFGGKFRDNQLIIDGMMRTVGAEIRWDYHPQRRISTFGFNIHAEISNPQILPSDFSFETYHASLQLRTPTLPLWLLDIRFSGGYSRGNVPPQRFFSLESSATYVAAESVFRGMNVKEFYGDSYAAIAMEHNFGEVIPGVLRVPNIASFGIEFIAITGVGWTQFSSQTLHYTNTIQPTTSATADGWYYEAGIGFNKILLFLRCDISARFSQRSTPAIAFTISGATY